MDEKNMRVISTEESIILGHLFFVKESAIKKQTLLAKEALKDIFDQVKYN